jgi:hypothetical protein
MKQFTIAVLLLSPFVTWAYLIQDLSLIATIVLALGFSLVVAYLFLKEVCPK